MEFTSKEKNRLHEVYRNIRLNRTLMMTSATLVHSNIRIETKRGNIIHPVS